MKLLAIDGNSVLNRAYYGVRPLTAKDGTPTNAIFGFLNILLKLQKDYSPEAVAIAFDVSRRTFRHEQYADYKATRKGMPDDLRVQLPLVQEILTLMGYKLATAESFEGDDVLGTLAAAVSDGDECIVATGDRDCLQLVTDNVSVCMLKTKDNILYTPSVLKEEYELSPNQIIELKSLMGDSSDNIPGVKGIGEKTALSLIRESGDIDTIYADVDKVTATPRIKKLLEEGKETAYLSRELATISTKAPIDTSYASYVRGETSEAELSALLTRLEMFSFFDKLKVAPSASRANEPEANLRTIKLILAQEGELPSFKKGSLIELLLSNDKGLQLHQSGVVYSFPESDKNDILHKLFDGGAFIRTTGAKPLYKQAKEWGYEDTFVQFDIELAAYLLNPSAKGYELDGLALRYLSDIQIEAEEEYRHIFMLPLLCDRMKAELENEGMLNLFETIEMPLCEVLADMEHEGFAVDKKGLTEFGERLQHDIDLTTEQIYRLAGEEFNINSTKMLGTILFEKLGLPAGKKTKTGYSTNVDVLEELMDKHEIILHIMEYRKLTKLYSTYVVGLLNVLGSDGRVHSTFNQTETRTGRISSTEPNVQNIPVRTKLGSEMRRFFVAREGYTLVDADYSQIELRILAHLADDAVMRKAFLDKVDIHAVTASQVFRHPLETLPSELRSRAKAINFGIVYGISAFSLSKDINVSVQEARRYMEAYLETYSGVAGYMKQVVEQAREDGYVTTLYGRRRELGEINSPNKQVKAFAERVALNTPVQGTAADVIKLAMIRVFRRLRDEGLDARLILQVHDELIVEASALQADIVKRLLKEEMEAAVALSVPMVADVNVGKDWYTAK